MNGDLNVTDNEIIKALKFCKTPVGSGSCNDCPFDYQRKKRLTSTDKSCTTLMFDYALDLINRQKAEIERLNRCIKAEDEVRAIASATIQAGIETIKAEAIKEFAERLKEKLVEESYDDCQFFKVVGESEIDNLVKEMSEPTLLDKKVARVVGEDNVD